LKTIETCNICSKNDLVELIQLPKMPLTGLYLDKRNLKDDLYDQALNYCNNCGHGQLKNVLHQNILYDNSYTHRTSASNMAMDGNDFLLRTIDDVVGNKVFNQILEVGCNDLYLINKLSNKAKNLVGIDPIWKEKDFVISDKVSIFGKFINELDQSIFNESPDLIVSSHTFEHINGIYEEFVKLVDLAADECLFFIEVPSLEMLVKTRRYDQITHQHLQYFSNSSMLSLIERIGCEFIGNKYNYSYWGGTSLYWFKKSSKNTKKQNTKAPLIKKIITDNFEIFKETLKVSTHQILALDEPIIGLGAAQMLPQIAYHMESNLEFVSKIYDDNDDRIGKYLSCVYPKIEKFSENDISDSIIMITALDSSRVLLKKILNHSPRRIFSLINII